MTDQLKPGDQIEVTDGDFANFRGELESIDGNTANIWIPVFGRVHGPIQIPLEFVRKAEASPDVRR